MDFYYVFAGFGVGFIVGLTGVGGGSLMTPILIIGFGIQPAIAVGTDLLYAALSKAGGLWAHHRRGNVDWRIVCLLGCGSIPSSLVTILVLHSLREQGSQYESLLMSTLSLALILTASVLLFKEPLERLGGKEQFAPIRALHRSLRTPMTLCSGVLIGVLVTLSSVGAGALGAAVLFFLYPRMPAIRIIGSDLAHAVPITAIAGLGHAHLGTVDFYLLVNLVIGAWPGILLGSHLGTLFSEKVMRLLLAAMLFMIGVILAF